MKYKSLYITKNDVNYSILDEQGKNYRSDYDFEKYLPLISMDIYGATEDVQKSNFVAKQKEYLKEYHHRVGSLRGTVFLLDEYDRAGGRPADLTLMASSDYNKIYNILGRNGYITDKERKLYRNFFYIHEFDLDVVLEKEELQSLFRSLADVILELYHIRVENFCYLVPPVEDYYQFVTRLPSEDFLEESSEEPYPEEFMQKDKYDFMTQLGFEEIGKTKLMVSMVK